ncbi:tRNA (adenosine(37)-N6)-threonylcarbamoyltransferase complex transferase subunit TsaD [Patescibacteria group bacterium]|nr:tRNA (adenosine(37)-N6)-threonylcarbamoyltransferase complex transferase subunit TsaD [Patescibacteria group bacterium]
MIRILGIETSCDETSVAILSVADEKVEVLHHDISTQIPVHERFGGVVPEVAARMHVAELFTLLERANALDEPKFDAIAVTRGPGLATALRVGIEAARTISAVSGIPLIGVNHLEGHLASSWLLEENRKNWEFPILALLVSGGHTELVLMKDFCSYRILGRTRDDAAGEAFDKTGKLLGLGYPGGPILSKHAKSGDRNTYELPRPMMNEASFDFSFSGLKSAVRRLWEGMLPADHANPQIISNLCASIQAAIVDVLVAKTIKAARKVHPRAICVVGGVSANTSLQEHLRAAIQDQLPGVKFLEPAMGFHTDNAAMIAAAGAWRFKKHKVSKWKTIDAEPELDL